MIETKNIVKTHGAAASAAKFDVDVEELKLFKEKLFVDGFEKLINSSCYEPALTFFLSNLEKLAKSNINRKEKLNHFLFMSRMIRAGGTTKHGYEKLLSKVGQIKNNIGDIDFGEGAIVELGCGVHDPLSLSLYFYLNGYNNTHAVDIQGPRNKTYSALSMYEILANMNLFPERYLYDKGSSLAPLIERLNNINIEAFEKGDFDSGVEAMSDRLKYHVCDIADADIEDESVALLVSFAVLEHVSDIDKTNEKIFRIIKPGGYAYHFIDLVDHRSYGNKKDFDPFTFLTQDEAPPSMNRLRRSEHLESLEKAGFEIVKVHSTEMEVPESTSSRMLNKWKNMSDEDKATIKLRVLSRRPA